MSGKSGPSDGPQNLTSSSNSNGAPVAGTPLNPPKPDTNPSHFPTASIPHLPQAPSMGVQQGQGPPPPIPPLMGVSSNAPPQPTAPHTPLSGVPAGPVPTPRPLLPVVGGTAGGSLGGVTNTPKAPTQGVPGGKVLQPNPGQRNESSGKQMKDGDSGGSQPKLPILRLKKTGEDDDSFEKQDVSKNDSYCWVCHDGGDVLCCDKCPRVFHLQCSGLQKPPEEEDDNEWFCSICKNIARKTKRSRPPSLNDLLILAVERMMFPGTEIFQAPVPPDIMTHYREYIFFPMHLRKIKEKVSARKYQSTREFTHDTEWILHNCIIYNGAKHALTKIAKNIVKVCKEDMREIELCPGCYKLTVKQPKDWFCIPCNPPHPVVLAKVRGYPLWPAKLISETSDKCDVRFFGQHDRSLVPKCDIKALNGLPPKPITKTKHWNQAMFELKRYGENIESMRDKLGPGGVKDKSLKLLMMKSKVTRPLNSSGGGPMQNSLGQQKTAGKDHGQFAPPVVEVTPSSDGPDGMGSLSDTEVSSPGTPPSLQIDLKDSGHNSSPSSQERTPSKGRAMPSGGHSLIGGISRNSQVPGSLDFNESGAQSVVVRSPSTNTSSKMMKRKGAALSALVSSLAQRKRVAEQVGALTPVHQGAAIRGEGMPGGQQEEAEATGGKGKGVAAAAAAEDAPGKTNSPFSSMYVQSCKTAFAIVDPDQKRTKRKTTKAIGSESPAPPAKKARGNNTASTADSSNKVDNGDLSDPAAFAARVQEFSNAAISALNTSTTTTTSSHPASNLRASSTAAATGNSRATTSVSPQNTSGSSNSSGTGTATLALPGLPKSRSTGGKKKKRTPADRNRGKSPQKGVVKTNPTATAAAAAAAAVTAAAAAVTTQAAVSNSATSLPSALVALISASSSSSAPSSSTTTSTASTSRANFMNMVAQPQAGVVSSRETPSAGGSGGSNGEVRGEIVAPGITNEEINDFAEGTGLLADTIRIVNSSFLARVNQMTGPSDDMGYKYFVEKLMASIKTVLMEILSTFDAKSRTSAKQLRDQLHLGWPVSNSSVAVQQLGKELRDEMKQSLEVVRASAALELEQVVNEVRRQVEKEKEIAIIETKKKKWCSFCMKEAQYNCCWNANYCNEVCQQSHWPEHMDSCTQVQQAGGPQTPASQLATDTPIQKAGPSGQLSPTLGVRGVSNGIGGPPGVQGGLSGQDSFMFQGASAAAAQVQSHAFAQAQAMQAHIGGGGGANQQSQGRMSPMGMVNHTGIPTSQAMSSSLGGSAGGGAMSSIPHSMHPSHQHMRGGGGLRHDQHSPLLHVDGMHPMDSMTTPSPLEKSASHIEQLPSDGIITTANTASPPNHIRNMLLNQHHQQSNKSAVITSSNPILMGHQSPAPPSHVHTPPMGGDMHRSLSNEHSNSLHPMSPATPPSENPVSVHNYGGWSYPHPQHAVLIGNDTYTHGLPLLPAVQANTPTTQSHAFFKTNY